jgi:hypothetical protein
LRLLNKSLMSAENAVLSALMPAITQDLPRQTTVSRSGSQ